MITLVLLIIAGVTIEICGASIIAKIFALFFTLLAFIFSMAVENITIALFLMPFAPLGFFIGYKLTQKIDGEKFYALTYACLLVIGIKLLMDGI